MDTAPACVCLLYIFVVTLLFITDGANAIGCFVCTSINHTNQDCEDTFNNTSNYYKVPCYASRRERIGKFPGTQCIKMKAEDKTSGYSVIVRNCVVDNGETNSDAEIGRLSHCGWLKVMKYNNQLMHGCIVSCETDGCNCSERSTKRSMFLVTSTFIAYVIVMFLA